MLVFALHRYARNLGFDAIILAVMLGRILLSADNANTQDPQR
jgi:hypothetical protein